MAPPSPSVDAEKANHVLGVSPTTDGSTPSTPTLADNTDSTLKNGFIAKCKALFSGWYYLGEVVGIILSAASIVSICVVVGYFDQKSPPNWFFPVHLPIGGGEVRPQLTLNSLLSMLSVIGSTCAMIPVSKGLGQLKYIWFIQQDRQLADLEMFDSASRSKLGSAQLVWKLRLKHLAVFGGLASLLALAYGPFVQNLIVTRIDYFETFETLDKADISWVHYMRASVQSGILGDSPTVKAAVGTALLDASDDWVVPPHHCPTGECFWEGYYTLAACTRCADITDLLEKTCKPYEPAPDIDTPATGGCNVSLPNGLATFYEPSSHNYYRWDRARNVMIMNATLQPLVYSNYSTSFATVQIIMGFDPDQAAQNDTQLLRPFIITEHSPLIARECAIVPCMQYQRFDLRSEQDSAVLIPDMHIIKEWDTYSILNDSETGRPTVSIDFTAADVNSSIPFPLDMFWAPDIGGDWYQSIRDWLRHYLTAVTYSASFVDEYVFETMLMPTNISSNYSSTDPLMAMFKNSQTRSWRKQYCNVGNKTRPDVECAMHKLAAGITNAMRAQTWEGLPSERISAQGIAYAPYQIIYAQWQYISAPIAVWVLGVILFVGVVIKTRRANLKAWRTSPLATLLLRLDQDSRDRLKDWQHLGDVELRELAEKVVLRLKVDEGGPPTFVKKQE